MAATLEAAPPDAASGDGEEPRTHRGRIRPVERRPMPADAALSWVITVLITAVAGIVRLWGIGFPDAKQFDEVYYATEGGEILHNGGYENNPGYMFIVHPPLGKWLVAAGITVFGDNSVGWRVPAAIAGTLCVAILVRVTRRMTRSTLLGAVAGILLAADGLSIVQSRFALLDIFLAVFVLAGFACLVVDRDRVRDLLAAVGPYGGRPGFRGWRLAGGVLLGLSCGVKWSGIWFLLGFGLLSVLWDVGARRAAGVPRPWAGPALRDLPGAVGSFVLAPVAAYLLSWSGWFLGENSYDRHWADTHTGYWSWLPGPIRSLLNYHAQMWDFHSTLRTPHTYQSSPWGWLVDGRPVLFYYPSDPSPTGLRGHAMRTDRARCRDAGAVVGVRAGRAVGAVDRPGPAGLARLGRADGVRRGLGDLVLGARPDDVPVLHDPAGAVPGDRRGADPRSGARAGRRLRAAADVRARRDLRVRRAGRRELGLAVADPHRSAHHVRGVAIPDLVPELDLAAPVRRASARPSRARRCRESGG